MRIRASFIIAKVWQQPKCPPTDKWIKNMWNVYTTEYYSAMRKDNLLPFATIQMNIEHIMLSEMVRKRKTNTV